MRYAGLLAVLVSIPAWSQAVKPTPGALTPASVAPPAPAAAAPTSGSIPKSANNLDVVKRLEGGFDLRLKMADARDPIQVYGPTHGVYLPGFGIVFTTEIDLAQNTVLPMFQRGDMAADRKSAHERKLKHLELLRTQMRNTIAECAKGMDFLGQNEQVVVSVRLLYQGWEDKSGLPDEILMKADRRAAQSGDPKSIKVEVQ
ncbi:exported hypothetical protein [Candidatus Sulfopaludibacter sp. SbA3]|nr:exported hypothetical protein [Candidatus Sulfopaludibacter sp. SbA3]